MKKKKLNRVTKLEESKWIARRIELSDWSTDCCIHGGRKQQWLFGYLFASRARPLSRSVYLMSVCNKISIYCIFCFEQLVVFYVISTNLRYLMPNTFFFHNGPGDRDSFQVESYQRLQKMVLNTSLLNMQHYKVRIKEKWSNPAKGVAPSFTFRCSSYWKGSLRRSRLQLAKVSKQSWRP